MVSFLSRGSKLFNKMTEGSVSLVAGVSFSKVGGVESGGVTLVGRSGKKKNSR